MVDKIVLYTELISKKNGKMIIPRKTGGFMLISKAPAQKAHLELNGLLVENKTKWQEMVENRQYPYKLHIFIYRKTKRKFDYINIVQMLFDVMQEEGWLEDDDSNHLIPIFDGFDIDKDNPRVEIWIE